MRIEKFEDLNTWQEARKLSSIIYDATNKYAFKKDFDLARQLRRSSVSVMANIAEGFGRYTLKDSKQFYIIARGSLLETRSHLYVALDRGLINQEEFNIITEQCEKTSKILSGLINSTANLMKQKQLNS
ncbi:MAG: four helix bundle protein [Candidatus Omnitrophota bacterium]